MLLILGVAACSASAPPPGAPVAVARACDQPDGARVRLTGYLRYPRGLLSFCRTVGGKESCDLALYADATRPQDFEIARAPAAPEPAAVTLAVSIGDAPGQMRRLPERYRASDVKLHLEGGSTATEGSRIMIDGPVTVTPADLVNGSPRTCYVTVGWARMD